MIQQLKSYFLFYVNKIIIFAVRKILLIDENYLKKIAYCVKGNRKERCACKRTLFFSGARSSNANRVSSWINNL